VVADRFAVLEIVDEDLAREIVRDVTEEGRRVLTRASEICRERYPERFRCACLPCSLVRFFPPA